MTFAKLIDSLRPDTYIADGVGLFLERHFSGLTVTETEYQMPACSPEHTRYMQQQAEIDRSFAEADVSVKDMRRLLGTNGNHSDADITFAFYHFCKHLGATYDFRKRSSGTSQRSPNVIRFNR